MERYRINTFIFPYIYFTARAGDFIGGRGEDRDERWEREGERERGKTGIMPAIR
jgi:hypothetical protein